jgi:hypothetical protein
MTIKIRFFETSKTFRVFSSKTVLHTTGGSVGGVFLIHRRLEIFTIPGSALDKQRQVSNNMDSVWPAW